MVKLQPQFRRNDVTSTYIIDGILPRTFNPFVADIGKFRETSVTILMPWPLALPIRQVRCWLYRVLCVMLCVWISKLRSLLTSQIEHSVKHTQHCDATDRRKLANDQICDGFVKLPWPVRNHYVNQCWNIVNLNLRNKLQWNLKRNSHIFTQEKAFENVVCEMAAVFCLGLNMLESVWILFIDIYFVFPRGQWVNVSDKNEETNVMTSCFSLFDIGHSIMHSPWVFKWF